MLISLNLDFSRHVSNLERTQIITTGNMSLATTLNLFRRSPFNLLSLFLSVFSFSALEVEITVEAQKEHAATHSTDKAKYSHTHSSPQMAARTLMKMKHLPMEHTVVQTFCGLLLMNSVTHWVSITLMSGMLSCIRTTLDTWKTSNCRRMMLMLFSTCTVRYTAIVSNYLTKWMSMEVDR